MAEKEGTTRVLRVAAANPSDYTRSDPMGERTVPTMEDLDPVVEGPNNPSKEGRQETDRCSTSAPVSEREEEQGREVTFT